MNDPEDVTIGVVKFLPSTITVNAGTAVTWVIEGPEPHSVTFVKSGTRRPQPTAFTFDEIPPSGPFDGSETISSGLGPRTDPIDFTVAFEEPGTYGYFCLIHSGMVGTVKVVEDGGETQAEIAARAEAEAQGYLDEGRRVKATFTEGGVTERELSDGTTEWVVDMGIDSGNATILAFAPDVLTVAPGDSVTFANNSRAPHTATFPGSEPPPPWWEAGSSPRVPGTRGATITNTEFVSTGTLMYPGVGGLTNWTFVAGEPGTYGYFCLYHLPSGMAGTIIVEG